MKPGIEAYHMTQSESEITKPGDTKSDEDEYGLNIYSKRDLVLVTGKGSTLFDDKGNQYIDCASNVGVSNIGHGNESVAKAIRDQYLRLSNCYGSFYNDIRAKLSKKLIELTSPRLQKVFYCNSGSESVEAAVKFARVSTGRKKIICAIGGFHGKTMGSLSATWNPKLKRKFKPLPKGFVHLPFNNIERFKKEMNKETAGVLLEVIQGEGGVRIGDKEFFREIRELCDSLGIILIIDEVQTGFGRTGAMFAYEKYAEPDILCLAKSIAGGLPMGAVVCSENINAPKGSHSSTFGGNPLACAAALTSLDFMEKNKLTDRAHELGNYLIASLRTLKSNKIKEIRGRGLMIGIELNEKGKPHVRELMSKGIIALLAGKKVIRLLPPLVITEEEIDKVVDALEESLC